MESLSELLESVLDLSSNVLITVNIPRRYAIDSLIESLHNVQTKLLEIFTQFRDLSQECKEIAKTIQEISTASLLELRQVETYPSAGNEE